MVLHFRASKNVKMRNFYNTIKPFYFVSKTFGFFPMTFEGSPGKENFVVKWADLIAPFLNGLLAVIVIVSISFYPLEDGVFTPLMTMTSTLIGIFGTVLNFMQLIFQISKHKTIAMFLIKVNNFDKKVCFWDKLKFFIKSFLLPGGAFGAVGGSQKTKKIRYHHLNDLFCAICLDDAALSYVPDRQRKASIHASSNGCVCFPASSELFLRLSIFMHSFGTQG